MRRTTVNLNCPPSAPQKKKKKKSAQRLITTCSFVTSSHISIPSTHTHTHTPFCMMQTQLQWCMSDRNMSVKSSTRIAALGLPLQPLGPKGVCVCVCVHVCIHCKCVYICVIPEPDARHLNTTHIVFSSGAGKREADLQSCLALEHKDA